MIDKYNYRFIYCFFFLNYVYLCYLDLFKIFLVDKKMGLLYFRLIFLLINLDRFIGFYFLLFKWNFFLVIKVRILGRRKLFGVLSIEC